VLRHARWAVVVVALGGAFALPEGAAAHALLQSSDPAAGSTVASAPSVVTLGFGEAPDPKLSSVKVLDASGQSVASGPAVAVPGQPDKLRVPLGRLQDGVYTVAWRTVSVVDGHTAAGSFAFGVGVSPSTTGPRGETGTTTSPSGSPTGSLGRFLLYLGLIGLFGAGFIAAAVHPHPPRSMIALAAIGWLISTVGTFVVVAIQMADAGADVGTFMSSALGIGVASRLLVAVGSGIVVALLFRSSSAGRRGLFGLAAGCAAGGMLVDVVNGHAAAGGLIIVQVVAQWVHILAAGVWMGGLAGLLLSVRGLPNDDKALAVLRFSRWAGVALAAIAATGVLRAYQEVGTIDALVTTDFGRLVIAKSLLLGILALLGAINHFISVPAAIRSLVPLRRVGRVEVTIGVVVVLATGILVNLAPPSSIAAAPSQPSVPPLVAAGNDFGTTVRVRLVVTPGSAGLNQFALAVTDYDSGAPVSASGVTLRFSPTSTPGLGGSSLALAATGPGAFAASGGNLSLDGIWTLTAVVAAQSGSIEVPLAVATRIPALHVEKNPVVGAPTIFTAHLGAGNSLQVYLDPGRPRKNELHATFFDASGNELPVPSATMLVSAAGGPNAVIFPRQLEPGHFVADLEATAGSLGVDVVGTAPGGGTLHAHFDIPVQS
jgi:copper transport protein